MLCIHFDNENCPKCKENRKANEECPKKQFREKECRFYQLANNYRSIQASKQAVR